MMKTKISLLLLCLSLTLFSCRRNYVPKPVGFFRIDLPQNVKYDSIKNMPYVFEYNTMATLVQKSIGVENPYWIDIAYPGIHATIHISYKKVDNNLLQLVEDAHKFVYKHSIKADAIDQKVFTFPQKNVAGVLYELDGNIASPMQFFATDSANHFLRAALYFDSRSNQDSLMPLVDYVTKDIHQMIETLEWK